MVEQGTDVRLGDGDLVGWRGEKRGFMRGPLSLAVGLRSRKLASGIEKAAADALIVVFHWFLNFLIS